MYTTSYSVLFTSWNTLPHAKTNDDIHVESMEITVTQVAYNVTCAGLATNQ